MQYRSHPNDDWQLKVQELAERGLTLEALFRFYRGLGGDYMPYYDPSRHTTTDVVRQAIIPLSRNARTDLAKVLMEGKRIRPTRMVTHNWGNLFRDLVAAVLADALGEAEFGRVAHLLEVGELDTIEAWLQCRGAFETTYWICAFSVNHHAGICSDNPRSEKDTVTGEVHPVCSCGLPKIFNTTPPVWNGKSVNCEMNKFDDMMALLACTDQHFMQVVAVDREFHVFSRAWCVAELAEASFMGMEQHLKICSESSLDKKQEELRHLKVEEMLASRKEDIKEILEKIPDTEAFNEELQNLIFKRLIAGWRTLDATMRMELVGQLARWEQVVQRRGTSSLWLAV